MSLPAIYNISAQIGHASIFRSSPGCPGYRFTWKSHSDSPPLCAHRKIDLVLHSTEPRNPGIVNMPNANAWKIAGHSERAAVISRRQWPKIDHPVRFTSSSNACVPSLLLPMRSSPGDHTAIEALPGAMASMPPPTPLLPGKPTR